MSVSNGDANRIWEIGEESLRGIGSFHKTLPHNDYGEVDPDAFAALVAATRGDGTGFAQTPQGAPRCVPDTDCPDDDDKDKDKEPKMRWAFAAELTNPQAGLAKDRLTHAPDAYHMPPAPRVNSNTAAAEMLELYWMALLRDADLCCGGSKKPGEEKLQPELDEAAKEICKYFDKAIASSAVRPEGVFKKKGELEIDGESDRFILGVDLPGSAVSFQHFNAHTLFRLGLPGDEVGPMISQFFLRPVAFGTQRIDQRQRPYKTGVDYLTKFDDWLAAQNSGRDAAGQSYGQSNEDSDARFESFERYIATMRDLARFVNKDALHQAYFNAALILLSGRAKWALGNPYHDLGNGVVQGTLPDREAGFGVLGGPHILALVSEVATRALKVVWRQKWQEHLRLRPEAYGGLLHVQTVGPEGKPPRAYGLPGWLADTTAAKRISAKPDNSLLLPMAFTAGSPTHPAYGAGHATVAGACVTILKAYFLTFTTDAKGVDTPIKFSTLDERDQPFGKCGKIKSYCARAVTPKIAAKTAKIEKLDNREALSDEIANQLTIEGELNKLAQNVAMGRSMGGVHWRTDNTRSLMLGEALAAEILAGITTDANEKPSFTFRTFSRRADGEPKKVHIESGRIYVDGVEKAIPVSRL